MMLNSRNNLYNFKFPKTFIPKEVADKYKPYLNRMPGNIIEEPIDFINYTIQGISMPGISFTPAEQNPNDGTITYKRGYQPVQNLTFVTKHTVQHNLNNNFNETNNQSNTHTHRYDIVSLKKDFPCNYSTSLALSFYFYKLLND